MTTYTDASQGALLNHFAGYQAGEGGAYANLSQLLGWPVAVAPKTPSWTVTHPANTGSVLALTLDRLSLVPVLISKTCTITDLAIEVTTLGASSVVRLGWFKFNADMTSLDLSVDAGTVDGSSTGVKEKALASPLVLQPGIYMVGVVAQAAGCTIRGSGGAGIPYHHGWSVIPRASLASDFAAVSATSYAYFGSVSGAFASSYAWSGHTLMLISSQKAPAIAFKWSAS